MDVSLSWWTRLRMLLATVLLPFAPVVAVAVPTIVLGVAFLVVFGSSIGLFASDGELVLLAFGSALVVSIALLGRTLSSALWRGRSKSLSDLPPTDRERELGSVVQRLAAQAEVDPPDVRIVERSTPQAYTRRHDDGVATIVVSECLLDALDDAERRAVLAHEVAHLQSRDVTVMQWATLPLAAADEMSELAAEYREEDEWPLRCILMAGVLRPYGLLCASVVAAGREYAADAGAASLTGDPAALASALVTLDDELRSSPDRDLRERSHVVALNVVPATDGGLLSTHPPTEERVERLRRMAEES